MKGKERVREIKEIKDKIDELNNLWDKFKKETATTDWLCLTYTTQTLHWVLNNLEKLPMDQLFDMIKRRNKK